MAATDVPGAGAGTVATAGAVAVALGHFGAGKLGPGVTACLLALTDAFVVMGSGRPSIGCVLREPARQSVSDSTVGWGAPATAATLPATAHFRLLGDRFDARRAPPTA